MGGRQRLAHSRRETPRDPDRAPLVPLQMVSPKLVVIERELETVFCTYLLNGRFCGQSVPVTYAVCAECDTRTSTGTGPQISHGTSVYLPFNIAICSLVPRTA